MNETYVTIQGRLVADPVLKWTTQRVPFAVFRIASTVRRPVNGRPGHYEDVGTSFYGVSAFRSLGTNIAGSLRKGEPVTVYGRQRVNEFTRGDGTPGMSVQIEATAVGHDLSFGTSAFAKVVRAQYPSSDRLADPAVQQAMEEHRLLVDGQQPDHRPTQQHSTPHRSTPHRSNPHRSSQPHSAPQHPTVGDPATDPFVVDEGPGVPAEPGAPPTTGTGSGPLLSPASASGPLLPPEPEPGAQSPTNPEKRSGEFAA